MQALSSYVFIAANVILHATKENQSRHLDELLPPIIPLLTSHHHSLRGFTQVHIDAKPFPIHVSLVFWLYVVIWHIFLISLLQLLVYQVFCKYFPLLDCGASANMPLEKKCFEDLKSYLARNPDCRRYDFYLHSQIPHFRISTYYRIMSIVKIVWDNMY